MSIGETIGYIGRILSAKETPNWTTKPYIIQSILILIAPTLFSASIYMVLGRLIRRLNAEAHGIIATRWLTKVFVASDIVAFMTQGAGSGLLATSKDLSAFKSGENIIIAGLFIQLIGFGIFMVVTAIFHYRIVRYPTRASQEATQPWQRLIFVLYFASAMILLRSVIRAAEYIQGYDGSLNSMEWIIYVFDSTPMLLAMVSLGLYHPSRILDSRRIKDSTESNDHELLP
jgi:hypothetical protein